MPPRNDFDLSSRGFPRAYGTPRPAAQRRREAGLLAPGSSLSPAFPGLMAQVACGRPLAGHSCGGSRGMTAFPRPRTWAELSASVAARQWWRRCVYSNAVQNPAFFRAKKIQLRRPSRAGFCPIEPRFRNARFKSIVQCQITAKINFLMRLSGASPCRARRISFCAHDIFQRRAGRRSVSLHLWGYGRNVGSTVTVQGGALIFLNDAL